MAVSSDAVYVGGKFSSIGGQPRNNIAALDKTTGAPTQWNPDAVGYTFSTEVLALAISGNTVYAGGSFTSIGGQPRQDLAALDATTGAATAWDPHPSDGITALAVSGNTVYAGGGFLFIGGESRSGAAALDAASGQTLGWNPGLGNDLFNGQVSALGVSDKAVYVGGWFANVGDQFRPALAAFSIDSRWIAATPEAWNDSANWDPPLVPDNGAFCNTFRATIAGAAADATVDIDPSIDALVIADGATLDIAQGSLTIVTGEGVTNDGNLTVRAGRALRAGFPFLLRGSEPVVLAGPTASLSSNTADDRVTLLVPVVGQGIINAAFVNDSTIDANVTGGTLLVNGPLAASNHGVASASDGGTLQIDRPIIGSGDYLADHGTILVHANLTESPPGAMFALTSRGGQLTIGNGSDNIVCRHCGPIIVDPEGPTRVDMDGAQVRGSTGWTIGDENLSPGQTGTLRMANNSVGIVVGDVLVRPNGTLIIDHSSLTAVNLIIEPGGTLIIASDLTLTAAFDIRGTDGSATHWSLASGSLLTLLNSQEPSAQPYSLEGWTLLEAASADAGPSGGVDDFAFADVIVGDGRSVSLVDFADNHPGQAEAVYCDSLALGSGAVLNLNGLNLYVGGTLATPCGEPGDPCPYGDGTIVDEPRGMVGDLNGDGRMDAGDLPGFVGVLLGGDANPAHRYAADLNGDGRADGADIQAFVALMAS